MAEGDPAAFRVGDRILRGIKIHGGYGGIDLRASDAGEIRTISAGFLWGQRCGNNDTGDQASDQRRSYPAPLRPAGIVLLADTFGTLSVRSAATSQKSTYKNLQQ